MSTPLWTGLAVLVLLAFLTRAVLRPHREPASRLAWVLDLNHENNILAYDPALTADVRRRQDAYLQRSRPVTAGQVAGWPLARRLWNNAVAMLWPVL